MTLYVLGQAYQCNQDGQTVRNDTSHDVMQSLVFVDPDQCRCYKEWCTLSRLSDLPLVCGYMLCTSLHTHRYI